MPLTPEELMSTFKAPGHLLTKNICRFSYSDMSLRKGARNTKEEKMYWLHLLWCKNFQQPPKQHQRNPKQKHFQISSEGLDMGGDPILLTNVYYSNY